MLRELAVRDLALIDRVRVAFEPGLTVITGETGAGKSLLIDALGLVMGARADTGLVRHGAAGARVEALFDVDAAPEPLICVREVSAEGRSVARIDDETRHGRSTRARWSGRCSRSTASTTSSGCCQRHGSATCSTRSVVTSRCARPWPPPFARCAPTRRRCAS